MKDRDGYSYGASPAPSPVDKYRTTDMYGKN